MGMPHNPQTIDKLKARYPAAVEDVYDAEHVAHGDCERPGELAKHVFDYEDGLRLIVSRESYPPLGRVGVHVSGSVSKGKGLYEEIEKTVGQAARATAFMEIVRGRFMELAKTDRSPKFIGAMPPMYVPHFIWWE